MRTQNEILAAWWRDRFVRGDVEVEEMEAGIGRALAGEFSDREWIEASRFESRRRMGEDDPGAPSLEAVDAVLKSLYLGPIGGET